MCRNSFIGVLVGIAVVSAIIISKFCDRYYAESIDFAWQLGLVQNIAEHWPWRQPEPYLAVMAFYPPVAHVIAAAVGAPFSSTLFGLIATSLVGVVGTYMLLFSMMRFNTLSASLAANAIFCAMAAALLPGYMFWGGEIVKNFFFSQIVGTFLSLVALYAISVCPGSLGKALLALVLTYLLGWVYPLAQVYVASSAFFLLSGCALLRLLRRQPVRTQLIASLIVLLIGLPLAIAEHPLFARMAETAQHNGAISGALPATPLIICAIALIVLAAALYCRLYVDRLDLANPMCFISLALGVACSAILQWGVLEFLGRGSEYITAKHSFGVVTLLAASAAVLFASFLRSPDIPPVRRLAPILQPLLAATTCCGLIFLLLPSTGRALEPLHRDMTMVQRALQQTPGPGALGASAIFDARLTAIEGFAIANGILRLPEESAVALYLAQDPTIPPTVFEAVQGLP